MSVVHPELRSTMLYIDAVGMGMNLGGAYKQVKRYALYTTELYLDSKSGFSNSSARVVYIYQYSSPVMLLYLVEVSLKDDVVYIYTPHIFKICFTGPPKNKRIVTSKNGGQKIRERSVIRAHCSCYSIEVDITSLDGVAFSVYLFIFYD